MILQEQLKNFSVYTNKKLFTNNKKIYIQPGVLQNDIITIPNLGNILPNHERGNIVVMFGFFS